MGLRNMRVGLITAACLVSVGALLQPAANRTGLSAEGQEMNRYDGLRRVMLDVSISPGAFRLYAILDDHARQTGRCWPARNRLMALLAVERRELFNRLGELRSKYVHTGRCAEGTLYTLFWAVEKPAEIGVQECTSSAQPCTLPVHNRALSGGPILNMKRSIETTIERDASAFHLTVCGCGQPFEGTDRQRCRCGLIHDPGSAAAVDPVAQAQAWLFRAGQGLAVPLGPADAEIALRALIAAKGPVRLYHEIRELVLSGRAAEARSYAWFVTVVGNRVAA